MRRLPRKRNQKQNLIIKAVGDYFGKANPEEKKSATKISLWLMNRRKGVVLDEEEKGILGVIKTNLKDKVYVSLLTENSTSTPLNLAISSDLTPINLKEPPLKRGR